MENGIECKETVVNFYKNYLFDKIKERLKKCIIINNDKLIPLLKKKIIVKNKFQNISRSIALNVLETYQKDKLCVLYNSSWNGIEASTDKPLLKYENISCIRKNNNGDYDTVDGNYKIVFNDFTVTIRVKPIYRQNYADFVFKFDENNINSVNKFFDIFKDLFKENYIEFLLKKRIKEIIDNEIISFIKISETFLNTSDYDTETNSI